MIFFLGKSRTFKQVLARLEELVERAENNEYGSKYVFFHNNQVSLIDLMQLRVLENIEELDGEVFAVHVVMKNREENFCLYFESRPAAEEFRKDLILNIKCMFPRLASPERMKEIEHFRGLVDDIEKGRNGDEDSQMS